MKRNIYEFFICILAVISVIFAIVDITNGLPDYVKIIDQIIYIIFVIDYFTRFIASNNKKEFIKKNIFDLIAIIPVNSAFRAFKAFKAFRLVKITKLAKLSKLSRLFTVSSRLLSKCQRFLNTNGFKYIIIVSCMLIVVGGTLISFFEGMSFTDGIWWAFVTTTTVGYGDISPSTGAGRVIACILMITGIGLIGSLTSSITSYFMNDNNSGEISNDKINMVLKLYDELNDSEKEEFKSHL